MIEKTYIIRNKNTKEFFANALSLRNAKELRELLNSNEYECVEESVEFAEPTLEDVLTDKLAMVKRACGEEIEKVCPIWKQNNILMGGDTDKIKEMKDYIDSCRVKSKTNIKEIKELQSIKDIEDYKVIW